MNNNIKMKNNTGHLNYKTFPNLGTKVISDRINEDGKFNDSHDITHFSRNSSNS